MAPKSIKCSNRFMECALKETTVFKWLQRFREGREDPKDYARSGRPSTSRVKENIDRVRPLVLSDCRLTVTMIAEELGLGKSSVHTILREHLHMKKLCVKTVPKLLTPDEMLRRKCWADCKTSDEVIKIRHKLLEPATYFVT